MNYIASLSCGKDSLAMVLRLLEEGKPLTEAVFYDTGMEYEAIYRNLKKISSILTEHGIKMTVLKPESSFLSDMLIKPVNQGKDTEHYGYSWCGGRCRWQTSRKVKTINDYLSGLCDYIQYVGIAYDEPKRIRQENHKVYPLVDWKMTEADCLKYCYDHGFDWVENGIDLYSILDRVSCWCCANKNLKELKNIYQCLPKYWGLLKGMQSKIDRPFRTDASIFDLEKRFMKEG